MPTVQQEEPNMEENMAQQQEAAKEKEKSFLQKAGGYVKEKFRAKSDEEKLAEAQKELELAEAKAAIRLKKEEAQLAIEETRAKARELRGPSKVDQFKKGAGVVVAGLGAVANKVSVAASDPRVKNANTFFGSSTPRSNPLMDEFGNKPKKGSNMSSNNAFQSFLSGNTSGKMQGYGFNPLQAALGRTPVKSRKFKRKAPKKAKKKSNMKKTAKKTAKRGKTITITVN